MIKALEIDLPKDYSVSVKTTDKRGFTPEEVAERCADKIIQISDTAHPGIREQAHAFKQHIETVLAFYMREAIKSDRTTTYNALSEAGYKELAEQIRRL
jgi:hypothetical protein|tara:strand:+ start:6450 stop:6746 length:297 start_codon:yes stop_codon:yes gene_type:complete